MEDIETEVEVTEPVDEPIVSQTDELVNQIIDQDFSKAGPLFSEILGDKIADALEQERMEVADRVFNGIEEPEDEEEDFDISDEELDELDQEIDYEEDD